MVAKSEIRLLGQKKFFQRDGPEELQVPLEITYGIVSCFSIFRRPLCTKFASFF